MNNPETRVFTFKGRHQWVVIAALEAAENMIQSRGELPDWTNDPDVGDLTVTVAVATRLHIVKEGAA